MTIIYKCAYVYVCVCERRHKHAFIFACLPIYSLILNADYTKYFVYYIYALDFVFLLQMSRQYRNFTRIRAYFSPAEPVSLAKVSIGAL